MDKGDGDGNGMFTDLGPDAPRPENLLQYLCLAHNTDDPTTIDPTAPFLCAPNVSRVKLLNLPVVFRGSAEAFQMAANAAGEVSLCVLDLLEGNMRRALPNRSKVRDASQQVTPQMYDLGAVLINQVILAEPSNSCNFGVGIACNALPRSYAETKAKQLADLKKEMGITYKGPSMQLHIPANSADKRQIPLISHVINGYHARSVTATFGGISTKQLWTGVVFFSPAEAQALGLPRPPRDHDGREAPEGLEQIHNSWCLVPRKHVLGHIAMLPPQAVQKFNYAVQQLQTEEGTAIPFLLMDLWTLHNYSKSTVGEALLKMDHRPLETVAVAIHPLRGGSWIEGCKAGEHAIPGEIRFSLIVTYTMFPNGCADNPAVMCALAPEFPRYIGGNRDATFQAPPAGEAPRRTKKGKEEEDDDDGALAPMEMDSSVNPLSQSDGGAW